MFKKQIFVFFILICLLITSAAAYNPTDIVFMSDAIDSTTRWISPVEYGGNTRYPTINSKWYEVRTTGTSPHVGMDLPVGSTYDVVAVTDGYLTKDTTDTDYNNVSLSTSVSGVYCHYEHMNAPFANGYYEAGQKIGIPGNKGASSTHLHFGAYSTQNISTRKSYRNETLYRNASTWGYGRHCDVFSQVQWLNNKTAQITASYSGSNNGHTEKPLEVRIYYRVSGSTWIDAGTMTNSSGYNYTYDFSSRVPSGTTIQWIVRLTRNISSSYYRTEFIKPKYYRPDPNPNSTSFTHAYYTSTVNY